MICECNNVSFQDIRKCVDKGITSYYPVQDETKAGYTCGSCAPKVIDAIEACKRDRGTVRPTAA